LKSIAQILIILFILFALGFAKFLVPFTKSTFKEKKNKELSLFFSTKEYKSISQQEVFEENEFILNGYYYDIEKVIPKKGGFLVICEKDKEETSFLNNIKKWVEKINKQFSEENEGSVFEFFVGIFNKYSIHFVCIIFIINIIHFSKYIFSANPSIQFFVEIPPEK